MSGKHDCSCAGAAWNLIRYFYVSNISEQQSSLHISNKRLQTNVQYTYARTHTHTHTHTYTHTHGTTYLQYFDMLKDVGTSNRASTIFLPHSPAGMTDAASQIRSVAGPMFQHEQGYYLSWQFSTAPDV
jgi:hypothetical protein